MREGKEGEEEEMEFAFVPRRRREKREERGRKRDRSLIHPSIHTLRRRGGNEIRVGNAALKKSGNACMYRPFNTVRTSAPPPRAMFGRLRAGVGVGWGWGSGIWKHLAVTYCVTVLVYDKPLTNGRCVIE